MKEKALTSGGLKLGLAFLYIEKSAEVIVGCYYRYEQKDRDVEVERTDYPNYPTKEDVQLKDQTLIGTAYNIGILLKDSPNESVQVLTTKMKRNDRICITSLQSTKSP